MQESNTFYIDVLVQYTDRFCRMFLCMLVMTSTVSVQVSNMLCVDVSVQDHNNFHVDILVHTCLQQESDIFHMAASVSYSVPDHGKFKIHVFVEDSETFCIDL